MPGYYAGRFRESGQAALVYATRLESMVLVEGPARILLSPEDRKALLEALSAEGVSV